MAEGMRHPSVSGGLEGRGEDGSERAHSSSALRGVCKFGDKWKQGYFRR